MSGFYVGIRDLNGVTYFVLVGFCFFPAEFQIALYVEVHRVEMPALWSVICN